MNIAAQCGTVIRKRRNTLRTKAELKTLVSKLALLLLGALLLFTQCFCIFQAPDNGMYPAIQAGDLVFGYRLDREYEKNDVVVYLVNGERKLGRVIGKEGDTVSMDEEGNLYVNGTIQLDRIAFATFPSDKDTVQYPYTVPQGQCFLLGDYRTQSEDSRDFGAIQQKYITAKIISVFRRRNI